MRIVLIMMRKEFLQIFRNRAMLPILFVMPVIQLLVLAFAVTYQIREVPISLVDEDRSPVSRLLVERMEASGYFVVGSRPATLEAAGDDLLTGLTDLILHMPRFMERDLRTAGAARVQMILDAQDGSAAGVVQAYANRILESVNADIQAEYRPAAVGAPAAGIRIEPRHWYNPALDYQTFMVPGILVLLVTMIGTLLSAMNVVVEKEIGTIDQLNVSPIRKRHFLVAKLLPFWIIALVELAVGLVVARLVFDIPMLGSITLLFFLAGVFLLVMQGFGLWISTVTDTQQQAMFIAWFILVIFILMSGLFTPIEAMPPWGQALTRLNPIAYFIEIMRRVLLKGAGFADVQVQFWSLVAYAGVVLALAVRQYRKVSA